MNRFALAVLALILPAAPVLAASDDEAALAAFRAAFGEACIGGFAEDGSPTQAPLRFDLKMPVSWGNPEAVVLWQFYCDAGAYNVIHVYLLKTEYEGIHPLALARPEIEVLHETPDDEESPVKAVNVIGWGADGTVMNADFDAATGTLAAHGLWRGLGDAYSAGTWVLKGGSFVLVSYEVDASFDGASAPQLTLQFP